MMIDCEYILAADSGGSKTVLRLLSAKGDILADEKCAGVAAVQPGLLPVSETLTAGIERVCRSAKTASDRISTVYFSLGGPNVEEVEQALRVVASRAQVTVDREANGNLLGFCSKWLECEAVVMAGTGTVALGFAPGARKFAGGWGPGLDDAGSGYEIGRRAVVEALLALDGRGRTTSLVDIPLGLMPDTDLNDFNSRMAFKMKVRELSRSQLAAFAPKVGEHALRGDAVAAGIVQATAEELAKLAVAVLPDREVMPKAKVLALGGVFKQGEAFRGACGECLRRLRPGAEFVCRDDFDLGKGACLMALAAHGVEIKHEMFAKLGMRTPKGE